MVRAIASTAEFKELIASGKKVIVDYHATWCGYVSTG
jgi:thiol-disulfide isomerase/thioredoxin